MPAPTRPAGPTAPPDMLWRQELRNINSTLLQRMTALENKFGHQEKRVKQAEEAAATCNGASEQLKLLTSTVEVQEDTQQEFMTAVNKRLTEMSKDMEDFKKTQERVQKLAASCRGLDEKVEGLSSLRPRMDEAERQIQGLKNTVDRKLALKLETLDGRFQALEQNLQSDFRNLQNDFSSKKTEIRALQFTVTKLVEARRAAPAKDSHVQVPRSPEARPAPSTATRAPLRQPEPRNTPKMSIVANQRVRRETEASEGTTQVSTQDEGFGNLDLDANAIPGIPASNREMPHPGTSPRKKPKLSHPKPQQQANKAHPSKVIPSSSKRTSLMVRLPVLSVDKKTKRPKMPVSAPQPANERAVIRGPPRQREERDEIGKSSKLQETFKKNNKRPGSPISAPKSTNERPGVHAPRPANVGSANHAQSRQQAKQGTAGGPRAREGDIPATQFRRSRRKEQVTFYELGWDETQKLQPKAGPVYDTGSCPPKKKIPRRQPPILDE